MIVSSICTIVSKLLGYDVLAVVFSGIAALTGIVSVCFVVRRWQKEKRDLEEYDKLLSDPFEMHFLIPKKEKYKISYFEQNGDEHLVEELQIPSGTEDVIFLWIKPMINIELGERYFGFESDRKGGKPEIRYYNPFVI